MTRRSLSVILLVNVALLAFSAYGLSARRSTLDPPFDESPVPYGTQLGDAAIAVTNQIAGGNHWSHVLMLFPPADVVASRRAARPLEELARTHRTSSLKIVKVEQAKAWFSGTDNRSGLPIIYDPALALHKAMHIGPAHRHGGLAVADRNGVIKFSTSQVLSPDELRQLVEKYAVGSVDYGMTAPFAKQVAIGALLPVISANHIGSGQIVALDVSRVRRTAVIFFASDCGTCTLALHDAIADARAFIERVGSDTPDHAPLLLFSDAIDKQLVLLDESLNPRLLRSAYQADISEFVAVPGTVIRNRPYVIYIDDGGRVEAAEPLPARREGGGPS